MSSVYLVGFLPANRDSLVLENFCLFSQLPDDRRSESFVNPPRDGASVSIVSTKMASSTVVGDEVRNFVTKWDDPEEPLAPLSELQLKLLDELDTLIGTDSAAKVGGMPSDLVTFHRWSTNS